MCGKNKGEKIERKKNNEETEKEKQLGGDLEGGKKRNFTVAAQVRRFSFVSFRRVSDEEKSVR